MPALPGPPISFLGVVLIAFCENADISIATLVILGVITLIITIFDYVAPVWLTNKKGGSKYSMWGAGIGLVIGLFFGVPGIILAPFIGAFIGELVAGASCGKALEIGFMSFVSFMLTTGLKLVFCLVLMIVITVEGINILWQ